MGLSGRENSRKKKGGIPSQMWRKQDGQYRDGVTDLMEERRLNKIGLIYIIRIS